MSGKFERCYLIIPGKQECSLNFEEVGVKLIFNFIFESSMKKSLFI